MEHASAGPAPEDRADSLPELFARHGIRGKPGKPLDYQPGAQTVDCPRCQHRRKGHKSASLHIVIDPDALGAKWACKNAGDCEWNAGQGHRLKGAGHSTGKGAGATRRAFKRPDTDHLREPMDGVYAWFQARGIPREVVDRCGVRCAAVFMPQTDQVEPVLAFPFLRDGEVVNLKYRTAAKHFRQEKDAEKLFWRLDAIRGQPLAVIVEGELDAMACMAAGVDHVASVPDGAPERIKQGAPDPSDPKFSYLRNSPELFAPLDQGGVARFVLAVDNDPPGRALEAELARRIGLDRCLRVRWPVGCKDANDCLVQHGPEALAECIAQAEPFPIEGVARVEDYYDEVKALYHGGLPGGVSMGWAATDEQDQDGTPLCSLRAGELVILTGIPGSGKSNLWDQIMVHTARAHGWGWGVVSMEKGGARHLAGMAALLLRKPFRPGRTPRMAEAELDNALAWLREHFHFIRSDTVTPTVESILARAELLVRHFGIRGLVLDPYTELDRPKGGNTRDTDQVDMVLSALRAFGRRHGVLACVVAHPNKPGMAAPKVPQMYDISGSSHWNNKADVGLSIFRDKENPRAPVEMHVKKVRFEEVGRLGVAMLAYETAWRGYVDTMMASYPVEFPPPAPVDGEDDDSAPRRRAGSKRKGLSVPPPPAYRDN